MPVDRHDVPPPLTQPDTQERWTRVSRIVDAALDLPLEARAAYVEQTCAGNDALLREVRLVLGACARVEGSPDFLGAPAPHYFAPLVRAESGPQNEPLPDLGGRILDGRYVIEGLIGRGGMAVVYRARDERHRRDVAVKVLLPDLANGLGADRFLREITIAAALQHPHIIPLYDSGEFDGLLYYVMPLIAGESLRQRIDRERQLTIAETLRIIGDVAEALDHAHARGVVHRDIKPENLLIEGGHALVADFGVARAIEAAGNDRLTAGGVVLGTAMYMSPEQISGDERIDGRCDVYALACVAYEMLAGEPPFTGRYAHVVVAKHLHADVPPLHIVRPAARSLELPLGIALAKVAADRQATAGELARALAMAAGDRVSHRRWPRLAAGLGALALFFAVVTWNVRGMEWVDVAPWFSRSSLDTTYVALFPLERDSLTTGRLIYDDLLYEAIARWHGVFLVDQLQVSDAVKQRPPIASTRDAGRLARSLGAGRYVRGRVTSVGERWRIHAALFDALRSQSLYQVTIETPPDLVAAREAFNRLADSLLLRGATAGATPEESPGSTSLPAVQAFVRAQRLLDDWDLAAADSEFESAVTRDPQYARADLWLAQVRAWRELPMRLWSPPAQRAALRSSALPERERVLARALVHLTETRFALACADYAELTRRNERDFAGWYGLGQCRRMDKLVINAPSSPSGFAFRASYRHALDAYARAFRLLPSVHRGYEQDAFDRLRVLLLVSNDLVNGTGPDGSVFYARPGWINDTLALVPYPWTVIVNGGAAAFPPGFAQALDHQRALFRDIATSWSAAFPRSAGAKHAVATSLELFGDPSAIDTIHYARTLGSDSVLATQLAATEVLLLVKFGLPQRAEYLDAARRLADTLLAGYQTQSSTRAELLVPIATLRGRCGAMTDLILRSGKTGGSRIDGNLLVHSQTLLAREALGCRPDSAAAPDLRTLATEISHAYANAPADRRGWADEVLLFRPALLAPTPDSVVIARVAASSSNQLARAALAGILHDTSGVRESLESFKMEWSSGRVVVGPDMVLPGARIWLSIGDSATAIRWLDDLLTSTRSFNPDAATEIATTSSLIGAMVLRADLAAARRDATTAHLWANACLRLLDGGEPDLRLVLQRLARMQ
jgi:serine/threonine protein kinase